LTINTAGLAVNQQSAISIVMHNSSAFQAYGTVVIYWSQVIPDPNNAGCYLFSNVSTSTELAGPDVGNTPNPVLIAARGTATFTFGWVPTSAITGSSQCPNLLGLFVQAYTIADANQHAASYCPAGVWHKSDFAVTSVYNGGRVFSFTPA
jgi:hypothetical protein